MKSTFIIILIALFPLSLLAQNAGDSLFYTKSESFYIGYSTFVKRTHLRSIDNTLDGDLLVTQSTLNYGLYADILIPINDWLTIQTGFGLHRIRLRFRGERFFSLCYEGVTGNNLVERESYIGYDTRLLHLGIPIGVKMNILAGDYGLLYTRLSAEFLHDIKGVDRKALYECGARTDSRHQEINYASRKNNVLLQVHLGYEFFVRDQRCFVEPVVAYSLFPTEMIYASDNLFLDTPFDVRYFQVGLGFGVRY